MTKWDLAPKLSDRSSRKPNVRGTQGESEK
jgi:hypothetical protein